MTTAQESAALIAEAREWIRNTSSRKRFADQIMHELLAELARVTEAHAAHWTGKKCPACKGTGEDDSQDSGRVACKGCGGTGEWHATWKQRAEAAESALAVAHAAGLDRYQHYKGGVYEVLHQSAYLEWDHLLRCVVYRNVETGKTWVRGFDEFHGTIHDGRKRFTLLHPPTASTGGSDAG